MLLQVKRELQQELLTNPAKHGMSQEQAQAVTAKLVPAPEDESMEPEKADLESKSLQDLHLRKTKKSKQLEKASERVAAAREAQLAANAALEKELECERAHKEALSEIKEVIRKKELANAVPVLSKVGEGKHDEATAVELLGFMQELLGKLQGSEHLADMAAPVTEFCGALDKQRAALQAKAAAQQAEAKRQAEEAAKQVGGGNDAGGAPSTGPAGNNADADDGFDWEDPDLGERLKAAGFPELDPTKVEDREKLKRFQEALLPPKRPRCS